MRIDGMDASAHSRVEYNRLDAPSMEVQARTKGKLDLLETKNLSQLTEFDRNELPISEKVVIDAIERANRAISGANRRFEISVHEKTNGIMVKVVDTDTNEVIREIPPEKILDLVAKMCEMAGLIVDERR